MSDAKLGQLIGPEEHRDAIHVAIAPVVAAETLGPGNHIGLDSEGKASVHATNIGIVDPFLTKHLKPGDRFYMVLYPNTVTGMRHHWSHPSFEDEVKTVFTKSESELWLRRFIDNSDCPDYDIVIAAATGQDVDNYDPEHYSKAYTNDGKYLHFNGRDAHGDIPPEFWDHIENVTGVKIGQRKRANAWSCSC